LVVITVQSLNWTEDLLAIQTLTGFVVEINRYWWK